MRRVCLLVAVVVAVSAFVPTAEARWGRRRSSGSSVSAAPAGGDTSTAQGVADIQARLGRVGHFGGNSGYEGCGMGMSPAAALANCCYSNSGMSVVDQGVAQGSGGRWYACKRYR